jgi:type IV secretion system protein VirB9
MTRATLLATLAIVVLTVPAIAEEVPRPGVHDARVRSAVYEPANVVEVVAADLHSTMIQFGADETVNVVAIGDQDAWAWSKVQNLLFIKPAVSPPRPSNMQVITMRRDGTQRVYQFDLRGQPADAPTPVFSITFSYPADAAEAHAKAAREQATAAEADLARQRLLVDYYYGVRNWRYVARGSEAIQPTEVSDNGEATAFRFPGNTRMPAIYQLTPDGSEQIADVSVDGDIAVVHGTAAAWRLRMGDAVCDLWNLGFDPAGQNPRTGTTSPDVIRTLRGDHQ